jgi:MFS family permease
MKETNSIPGTGRAPNIRIIGAVSAAHFVAHYYLLLLAPLLPFVRAEYGVTYTEIGLALTAYNVISTAFQTPVGFLVDWLGARLLLIGGLLTGAGAFVTAGLVDSYWVMVAMFALAGLGNTVYHPANYVLLSHHIPAERIGQAFSFHTFAGILGAAVAPASLLLMKSIWGWRGAFIGAGVLGVMVAAILAAVREGGAVTARTAPVATGADSPAGWRLLLSAPILLNLFLFALLATMNGGIHNYSVVALGALNATPVTTANVALSLFLLLSAIGVLVGGVLVGRKANHALVATVSLAAMVILTVLIALVDLGLWPLLLVMTLCGFFNGVIMPSRDMIVREITPPGSFGKVFGFVTTGFNLGGIVAPLIFGALMDYGNPRLVFLLVAACGLIAIFTVATLPRRQAA